MKIPKLYGLPLSQRKPGDLGGVNLNSNHLICTSQITVRLECAKKGVLISQHFSFSDSLLMFFQILPDCFLASSAVFIALLI